MARGDKSMSIGRPSFAVIMLSILLLFSILLSASIIFYIYMCIIPILKEL